MRSQFMLLMAVVASVSAVRPSYVHPSASVVDCREVTNIPRGVKAVFINLDKRTDRRKHFEDSVSKYFEPFRRCLGWSLERFPAVQAVKSDGLTSRRAGQLAAARSHISALRHVAGLVGNSSKLAAPATPVLIFEDDFHFEGDPAVVTLRLEHAFAGLKTWDVMMLGDNSYRTEALEQLKEIRKTKGAWCSEAYMIRPEYLVQKLLPEVEMQFAKMNNGQPYIHPEAEPMGPAFDTLWYGTQQATDSNWYIFRPKLGQQANVFGDSNISLAEVQLGTSSSSSSGSFLSSVIEDGSTW